MTDRQITIPDILDRFNAKQITREQATEEITTNFRITELGATDLLDKGIPEATASWADHGWSPCRG